MPRPRLTPEQRYIAEQKAKEARRQYYITHRDQYAVSDLSKAYIYKLVCDESELVYIGASTIQPKFREAVHRRDIDRRTSKTCNIMADIAPGAAWRLVVLTQYPCDNKTALDELETVYISHFGSGCLNKNKKKYDIEAIYHIAATIPNDYMPDGFGFMK